MKPVTMAESDSKKTISLYEGDKTITCEYFTIIFYYK